MKTKLRLSLLSAAVAALAACGGGGDDVAVAPAPTPDPAPAPTTSMSVSVIDGAIQNALVCLDANNNGSCDPGETQAKTDASGKALLDVPTADVGKYAVVAMVGTDAVDANSGPVPVAYLLKAPADMTSVVSPLTTLVERLAEKSGATSAEAEASLRTQLGLSDSLFKDYTNAADKHAAILASVLVQITQNITTTLAPSVGQADSSGGTIAAANIAKEITNAQLDRLASVRYLSGTSYTQESCANGMGNTECKAATLGQANFWASSPFDNKLTLANIATAVGIGKQIAGGKVDALSNPAVATAELKQFQFVDASNWYISTNVSSAEDNTPINDLIRFQQKRARSVSGAVSNWGYFSNPAQGNDLHWNGSAWVGCPMGTLSTTTVPDVHGTVSSNFCDGLQNSVQTFVSVDIAGKSLADVVNTVKAYPYTDNGSYGTPYASWGPSGTAADITAALGANTFPTGSSIRYGTSLLRTTAAAYTPADSNLVTAAPADAAAGGDARTTSGLACSSAYSNTNVTSLEDLIARMPGKPCINNPGTMVGAGGAVLSSGPRNEAWGGSVVGMGSDYGTAAVGTASTATTYYTGNTRLRLGFTGGGSNAVTFYECQQRSINGSTRNCDAVGTGTYTITTQGDARVMTFSEAPGLFVSTESDRAFIERGGKVYFGYKSKTLAANVVRLNLTAGNALINAYIAKGAAGMAVMAP